MSIKDLAAEELQRRLASLSTAELMRIVAPQRRSSPPPARRSSAPPRMRSTPPEGQLTVAAAVLRAVRNAGTPLTSGEIVIAAAALRPGTLETTIRAEVSRLNAAGKLRLAPGAERRFRAVG